MFGFDLPPLAFAVEILVSALGRKVAIVFAIVGLRRITSLDHALHLVPCFFHTARRGLVC
jgi:hypothetical protein